MAIGTCDELVAYFLAGTNIQSCYQICESVKDVQYIPITDEITEMKHDMTSVAPFLLSRQSFVWISQAIMIQIERTRIDLFGEVLKETEIVSASRGSKVVIERRNRSFPFLAQILLSQNSYSLKSTQSGLRRMAV